MSSVARRNVAEKTMGGGRHKNNEVGVRNQSLPHHPRGEPYLPFPSHSSSSPLSYEPATLSRPDDNFQFSFWFHGGC